FSGMSRFRLVISESLHSMRANLSTTIAATMTVLIGMFLLGLFIALGTWVLSWSDHVKRGLEVKVYFADGTTRKQTAEKQMRAKFPELYKTPLPSNPLPDAYVVTPLKGEFTPALGRQIQKAH